MPKISSKLELQLFVLSSSYQLASEFFLFFFVLGNFLLSCILNSVFGVYKNFVLTDKNQNFRLNPSASHVSTSAYFVGSRCLIHEHVF